MLILNGYMLVTVYISYDLYNLSPHSPLAGYKLYKFQLACIVNS